MTEELLPWYNRELSYFRRLSAEFARKNPKIAARLKLGNEGSQDPHVERLIEAFAYLNARIRRKLDDDFPELTDALLNSLYPHYLAPLPSMFIAELTLSDSEAPMDGYEIDKGTSIETESIQGEPCRFRTGYATTLYPIRIRQAHFHGLPLPAPSTPNSGTSQSVICIEVESTTEDVRLADVSLSSLRFFLHGAGVHVNRLYELLLNHVVEVALATTAEDTDPILLDASCVRPVGFEREDELLDYPPQSQPGHPLLTEFFAYPARFQFVDLTGFNPQKLARFSDRLQIYLYLDCASDDLEANVSGDTFRLGCTPAINLFSQRTEPIYLDQTTSEYRVVADSRRPGSVEIHSIDGVTVSSPEGDEFEVHPFYSAKHRRAADEDTAFWCHRRVDGAETPDDVDEGTEIELTIVDLDFQRSQYDGWYADIVATCCNRDLPGRLPFGGGQPRLHLPDGHGSVESVRCLTAPTRTIRPERGRGAFWRLISQLSLNHLSITDGQDGATAMREILQLYDFSDDPQSRSMIDGIVDIRSERVTRRIPGDAQGGFCRGTRVVIEFEPERYPQNNLYLFASVLNRFLGLYCSINSFTQVVARQRGRTRDYAGWDARAGDRVLL